MRGEIYFGGIDPSASYRKPSGCVLLDDQGCLVETSSCHSDEEILDFFTPYDIKALAIDAPKGLPLDMGLCCLEYEPRCDCPEKVSRACEREMRKRGFALFPVSKSSFNAAKDWIRRGLLLFVRFQGLGVPCYEVYPSAAKKILLPNVYIPKPKSSIKSRKIFQKALRGMIANIPLSKRPYTDHELDAMIAAYVVFLHVEKEKGELVGDAREGAILLPSDDAIAKKFDCL